MAMAEGLEEGFEFERARDVLLDFREFAVGEFFPT